MLAAGIETEKNKAKQSHQGVIKKIVFPTCNLCCFFLIKHCSKTINMSCIWVNDWFLGLLRTVQEEQSWHSYSTWKIKMNRNYIGDIIKFYTLQWLFQASYNEIASHGEGQPTKDQIEVIVIVLPCTLYKTAPKHQIKAIIETVMKVSFTCMKYPTFAWLHKT